MWKQLGNWLWTARVNNETVICQISMGYIPFFFLRRLISEKTVQPYNVDYDNQSASGTLPANGSPSSRPSSYLSARGSSPGDERPTLRISYIEDEENTINTEDLPIGDIRTYDTTRLDTISLDSNDSQHQSYTRKWCHCTTKPYITCVQHVQTEECSCMKSEWCNLRLTVLQRANHCGEYGALIWIFKDQFE